VVRLTQGSPTALARIVVVGAIKLNRMRRTRSGEGAKGGRFTGSTDDSGPMKPGNRVEDKTLTIRKELDDKESFGREPAACDG
jgi:hypothetical protein